MPSQVYTYYLSQALRLARENNQIYYVYPEFGINEEGNEYIRWWDLSQQKPPKNVWHLAVRVAGEKLQTILEFESENSQT